MVKVFSVLRNSGTGSFEVTIPKKFVQGAGLQAGDNVEIEINKI